MNKYIKIFSSRDANFDACRSFLVISMIFTHVFENLYLPDYNRRLTFFVTIGFVLISGFVLGGKSSKNLATKPLAYFNRYFRRFVKLFLVYFFCNIPIMILEPSRIAMIHKLSFLSFFWIVSSGGASAIFGFDILPAIAFTTLFSWVVISMDTKRPFFLSLIIFFMLWIFEFSFGAKFINIRLLLIGIYGCFLGKAASHVPWNKFIKIVSDIKILIVLTVLSVLYFVVVFYRYWPNGSILLWRHLIPTTLLLLLIYLISDYFQLENKKWMQILNTTIGKYMLFSYIFHIGLIKLALMFAKGNFDFKSCLFISTLLTSIMIGICYLLDIGRKRFFMVSKTYALFFEL